MMRFLVFSVIFLSVSWVRTASGQSPATPEYDFLLRSIGNAIRVSNSSNGLALDLFKRVSDQYNVFIAPFSISTVLAMTYQGAAGRSAEELARVMGYSHTKDLRQSLLDGFKSARTLISQETGQNDLIDLNMMQVDARLKILPEMKQKLTTYFGTNVEEVNFARADTLKILDTLVAVKTKGNIKKAFGDKEIPPNTVMVLANIIYFKGIWEKQFDAKNTVRGTFFNEGQKAYAKEVDMMRMLDYFQYAYYPKLRLQALDLGYKGYQLRMLILLPDDASKMGSIIDNLKVDDLTEIVLALEPQLVEIELPKFRVSSQLNMKEYLQKMSMRAPFDPNQAELPYFTGYDNLYINEFWHQAVIDVNEQGTTAAATTVAAHATRAKFVKFQANEPFIFLIRDSRTNLIIFAGKVSRL
ncbi:leukocyte elastase inhibitor [Galendromus occidentalis]|uniref:Leukocyte elastase inhibitor n=1 Tax=Galendromus occidentalis TaxID=34638 RepID=A0AAJ7SEN1_9ACAR|nr:leukocyte elastase inhibitor [Galendromus occidentalis]